MRINENIPPRTFAVGLRNQTTISDCGDIHLEPNESVTFVTGDHSRLDFARKDWGFYATPSVNKRLVNEGFKTAIVKNLAGAVYIMVVKTNQMERFYQYLDEDKQEVIQWLDTIPLD